MTNLYDIAIDFESVVSTFQRLGQFLKETFKNVQSDVEKDSGNVFGRTAHAYYLDEADIYSIRNMLIDSRETLAPRCYESNSYYLTDLKFSS